MKCVRAPTVSFRLRPERERHLKSKHQKMSENDFCNQMSNIFGGAEVVDTKS